MPYRSAATYKKTQGRVEKGVHETVPSDAMTIRELVDKYVIVPDRSNLEINESDVNTDFNVDPGNRIDIDVFEAHEMLHASKQKYDDSLQSQKKLEAEQKELHKKTQLSEREELEKLRKKQKEISKNTNDGTS